MEKDKFVDIIGMGKLATIRQSINKDAINGTTGVLKNDQNELYTFKTIDEIIRSIPSYRLYNYSSMDGGSAFKEAIMSWVFKNYLDEFKKEFFYSVIPTPGSAAGLALTLKVKAKENEEVLVPNIYWSNYDGILNIYNTKKKTYNMFKDNHFDIESFIKNAEDILKDNERLIVLFNDPCHNPTGYSLDGSEWNQIIEYINSLKKRNKKVIILYDIAYIDYAFEKYFNSRDNLALLSKLDNHVLTTISFSGSKSFAVYGLRLGAQIVLSKDEEELKELKQSMMYVARATWSSPPTTGIQMMITLMSDEKLRNKFLGELFEAREMLAGRKKIFVDEAIKIELSMLPLKDGFFVTIPTNNPYLLREELLKEDIHVVPQTKSIRIAISNIPTRQIEGLATAILKAKNKINE
ncbi:aminotransferase class I/II-fold pyridoxal phosphate-dependent enzyme [Acholeplasma sp. OttesenSCG-928-E16]|nr:aminotransferase class I/II-fold pyridoxal phosphate-dependent enzyme [Acholeplasma sp. OttesenSCG-928-E16]